MSFGKALQAMKQGQPFEEAILKMGYELTNKLLHAPTCQLREAASRGDEVKLDWAATLLGIKEHSE